MNEYLSMVQAFGLPSVALAILAYWFSKKDSQHREDFKVMIESDKKDRNTREDRYADLSKQQIQVVSELNTMIKTFIEINKR